MVALVCTTVCDAQNKQVVDGFFDSFMAVIDWLSTVGVKTKNVASPFARKVKSTG